jgi:hypothetical protein
MGSRHQEVTQARIVPKLQCSTAKGPDIGRKEFSKFPYGVWGSPYGLSLCVVDLGSCGLEKEFTETEGRRKQRCIRMLLKRETTASSYAEEHNTCLSSWPDIY